MGLPYRSPGHRHLRIAGIARGEVVLSLSGSSNPIKDTEGRLRHPPMHTQPANTKVCHHSLPSHRHEDHRRDSRFQPRKIGTVRVEKQHLVH